MENKPHDLEDKGLTGILERWAEGTGDPKFQEYINQIGGYEELLTVIKYISARTGRPEKTIVDMIVKIEDYPIFEKIMGEYKNGR
ncbi:hypothetical protein J4425_01860 [Candidatus Woesearchaeota archaeon]|nr:hypothetical protein [Candidatus Woesearchaeota archaeon]